MGPSEESDSPRPGEIGVAIPLRVAASDLPLVSILIPCYNAETWVADCVESALRQTYPNKEVIVVDDGSTDGSAEVICKFGDRITFKRVPNAGANATRNYLTQLARGEWLQYLDADDYLLPEKIASQVDLIRSRPDAVDVVYSPMIMHDASKPDRDYIVKVTDEEETLNFIRWNAFGTHGMMLRKAAVLSVGGWKENQPCCQEHELLLRLLVANSSFALCRTPGAVYRKHGAETISTRDPMRTIRIRMSLTDQLERHLKSSGSLNPAHCSALFVVRMEAARSAFNWDAAVAQELCTKAFANGSHWSERSPALPWSYRLAFRLAGFRMAELAARKIRFLSNRSASA